MQTIHDLKLDALYFNEVAAGKKRAEIRLNDRNYREKDLLILRKWDPIAHAYCTDKPCVRMITSVLGNLPGLAPEYVLLSMRSLETYEQLKLLHLLLEQPLSKNTIQELSNEK